MRTSGFVRRPFLGGMWWVGWVVGVLWTEGNAHCWSFSCVCAREQVLGQRVVEDAYSTTRDKSVRVRDGLMNGAIDGVLVRLCSFFGAP